MNTNRPSPPTPGSNPQPTNNNNSIQMDPIIPPPEKRNSLLDVVLAEYNKEAHRRASRVLYVSS